MVDYKAQVSWMYNSEYIIFTIKSTNLDVYQHLISWCIKVLNLDSLIQLRIKTLKKNSKHEKITEKTPTCTTDLINNQITLQDTELT